MNLKIKDLQAKIDKADDAYYIFGNTKVEDSLYDKWKSELESLAPQDIRLTRVGASVRNTILQKTKHSIPMGSQFKAMNEGEYRKWITTIGGEPIYHASHKMDGGSFSFEYQEGRLVSAVSRGDGLEGEDITANALKFQGIPKIIREMPDGTPFTGFIRGEVVMHMDDWKQADPDQLSNPRNLAVGIARRKSGEESELLTVYAFRIFDTNGVCPCETEQDASLLMQQMGFNVAPWQAGNAEEIWAWYDKVRQERPGLKYWIDGIVVKVDELEAQLAFGETDNRPKGQIAIKFEAEGAITTLRSVELSTGHTGSIVPVGLFDPVQIGGTTVSRATLCNWSFIRELNLGIGDKVVIVKSGDIIPMVTEVTEKVADGIIPEPTQCPSCLGPVQRQENIGGDETTAIYCQNPNCPGKVFGKIERFLKSLQILGGGDSLIQALIDDLGITDAADLYNLEPRRRELAGLKLSGTTRFGASRANKFLAEMEKARKLTLSEFLGSLGITGLGKRRVALIQVAVPGSFDELEDWLSGKLQEKAQAAGIPGIAERIQKDLMANQKLINKFMQNGVEIMKEEKAKPAKAGSFTICITGSLSKPKAYFWDLIAKAGHVATDDFSKSVTHLVAADPNGDSNKLKKARKAGIPVWSERDLLKLVGA